MSMTIAVTHRLALGEKISENCTIKKPIGIEMGQMIARKNRINEVVTEGKTKMNEYSCRIIPQCP